MPLKKTTTKPDAADALVGSDTPGFTGGIDPKMILTNGTSDVVIHTPVIAKIIYLCGFSDDSVMVKFIKQKQWKKLFQVTSISVNDLKDFHTVKKDGLSIDEKPLMIHLRMLKCFLMYYKHKSRENDKYLTEDDVMNIERDNFYSYCGSDDYFTDLSASVMKSSTKQINTLDKSIVDVVNAPEILHTEDVCGSLSDEGLEEALVVNVDVDVDSRHVDVINDGLYVSDRNISENARVKIDLSKCLVQKHLEEVTASDGSYCRPVRKPNGEYGPYREDTNISNVLVDESDTVHHFDETKGVGKPPYEFRDRNTSKQEEKERFIVDGLDIHETSNDHGSKCDPQVDVALMTFDLNNLVNNTYGDDNEDDDDNVGNSVAVPEEIEADDDEDVTSKMQEMIPEQIE